MAVNLEQELLQAKRRIAKLEAENKMAMSLLLPQKCKELEAELDKYKNGYKGACYACEPVAEQNERLRSLLRQITTLGACYRCREADDFFEERDNVHSTKD